MTILSCTSINRCRMRFLGAALYGLSGADNRSDYARFCDLLYRPGFYAGMDAEQIRAVPMNRKWYALLDHGVQLKTGCLQRLLHGCPELGKVLNNELWTVLGWDSQDPMVSVRFIETHQPRCRALEGSTYRGRVNARMKWALGVPDWTRLAVPLALLADVGHPLQRRWLNEHFCNYLALASLAPPQQDCFVELWSLINEWLCARQSIRTKRLQFHWSPNRASYELRRYRFEQGRDVMIERGWLPQREHPSKADLAMLWCIYLGGRPLVRKLLKSLSRGVTRCPRLLRQLMRELDPRLDITGAN